MGVEAYPLPLAVDTAQSLIGSLYDPTQAPPIQQQVFGTIDPVMAQMLGMSTSAAPKAVAGLESDIRGIQKYGGTLLQAAITPPPEIQKLIDTSVQIMNAYQTGNLPPGQQAIFDAAQQQMTSQINQVYASLGLQGSTAQAQALSTMEIQLAGAKGELLNQDLQLAQAGLAEAEGLRLQAAQLGLGALGMAGGLQQELIRDSMEAIKMATNYNLVKNEAFMQNLSLGEALRQSEQWPLEFKLATQSLYAQASAQFLGLTIDAQSAILQAQVAEDQAMWSAIGDFFQGLGSIMGAAIKLGAGGAG
jgi:hypothetical protein